MRDGPKKLYLGLTMTSLMTMVFVGIGVILTSSSLAIDPMTFYILPTNSDGTETILNCEAIIKPVCQNPPSGIVFQAGQDGLIPISTNQLTWDIGTYPETSITVIDGTGTYSFTEEIYTINSAWASYTMQACGTVKPMGDDRKYTCSEWMDSTTYHSLGDGLPGTLSYVGSQGQAIFEMRITAHLSDEDMTAEYPNTNYVKMTISNIEFAAFQRTQDSQETWVEVFGSPRNNPNHSLMVDVSDGNTDDDDHWDPYLSLTFVRTQMPVTNEFKFVLSLTWDIQISDDSAIWDSTEDGDDESKTYYVD